MRMNILIGGIVVLIIAAALIAFSSVLASIYMNEECPDHNVVDGHCEVCGCGFYREEEIALLEHVFILGRALVFVGLSVIIIGAAASYILPPQPQQYVVKEPPAEEPDKEDRRHDQ